MLVSYSNPYSTISPTYGHSSSIATTSDLQAITPISPIGEYSVEYTDIDDINYDKVNKFANEDKIAKNNAKQSAFKQQPTDTQTPQTSSETQNTKQTEDTESNGKTLSEEEKVVVDKLKTIDIKVRQHEQAHLTVAGGIAASGASYTYQAGPDGKQYAVGGEVNIDTSTESTPEATIQKMNQVIAAAMAPADPSGQDFSVASSARRIIAEMGKIKIQQNQTNFDQQSIIEAGNNATEPVLQSQASSKNNNYIDSSGSAINTINNLPQPNTNATTNNSFISASQRPRIEEPISTLAALATNSHKIDVYKKNDINASNNLSSHKINIIVA